MNSTCPRCRSANVETISHGHPMVWHWLINPGAAVNELLFGMRLPRVCSVCRDCRLPLADRSWVECPNCGELNSGRLWTGFTGFGNWCGLVCPACGQVIPSIWNYTSRFLLGLTSPLWYFPVRRFRPTYLRFEVNRIRRKKKKLQTRCEEHDTSDHRTV